MIDFNEDSLFAEQSVIGGLLKLCTPESKLMIRTMSMLKPTSFYKLYHKQIFSALQTLFAKNENIDLDLFQLKSLCETSQFDIRVCLNVLLN